MQFCKEFNEKTAKDAGTIFPVVLTVYQDKSFEFITKTPPAPVLLKKAANLQKASGKPDLNAASLESAVSMIKGTARSMGIVVTE